MKIYIEFEEGEQANSFGYAKAFYEACQNSLIDVEKVAKMMLLEAQPPKGE